MTFSLDAIDVEDNLIRGYVIVTGASLILRLFTTFAVTVSKLLIQGQPDRLYQPKFMVAGDELWLTIPNVSLFGWQLGQRVNWTFDYLSEQPVWRITTDDD